jgi:hypothetical protein
MWELKLKPADLLQARLTGRVTCAQCQREAPIRWGYVQYEVGAHQVPGEDGVLRLCVGTFMGLPGLGVPR